MTTRIPPQEITGPYGALIKMFSTRMFGRVPESLGVMWHNVPVLKASMGFGRRVQKWDQCDETLKSFAHMAVASYIGCSWCLDFNYFTAFNEGLDVGREQDHRIVVVVALAQRRDEGRGDRHRSAARAERLQIGQQRVFECRLADDRQEPAAPCRGGVVHGGLRKGPAARAGGTAECRPAG